MERSNFFPSISLNGGWLRQQSSGNTTELPQSITHYYDASLNASWELDIFGSIRQRVKAQRETFQASREEYISVQVSLCAQVASAYINLRELQQELQVVMHNCRTQEEVLNITEVRYNTGLVSKLGSLSLWEILFGIVQKHLFRNWNPESANTSTHWLFCWELIRRKYAPHWKESGNCPTTWNLLE